jgi:hypothetical protein
MPNRRTLITLAVLAAAVSATACTVPAHATGHLVDVDIVDRSRRDEVLPTYRHRGVAWVAGRPGDRYAVRMRNRTAGRVLVVLSVDGVNAISGETAATAQTGYVLAPYQSAEITGWRKNMNEAAAFYFTAISDSYAARTGRPDNVGVIGVAVFRERVVSVAPPRGPALGGEPSRSTEADAADRPAAAPASKAAAPDERLGTGHGEREYAPVSQTAFERASDRADEIVRIRYDSLDHLVAAGVLRAARPLPTPDPFPNRFVPDPAS